MGWSMDEQGKLKLEDNKFLKGLSNAIAGNPVFNYTTNKDGTVSLEKVDKRGFRDKILLTLDSKGRIIKIHHELNNDSDEIVLTYDSKGQLKKTAGETSQNNLEDHRTTFFSYKDDTCYPAVITSDVYMLANTALCQELREYLLKNKDEAFKCVCGTNKTNKAITDIFNSHREMDFNGKKITFDYDLTMGDPQGIFSSKDKGGADFDLLLSPSHNAIDTIHRCFSYKGVSGAIEDKTIWEKPTEKSIPPTEVQGDPIQKT